MKLKIFHLLTVSIVTLELLKNSASAFNSDNRTPQTSIKEIQSLKGNMRNTEGVDSEWIQNQRPMQGEQAVIGVTPNTTQSRQSNFVMQNNESPGFFAEIFFTFVVIGFILGCIFQYLRYKKERDRRKAAILLELEMLENIRLLERKNLEKIEKMKADMDKTLLSQREKQIETLERIWKINDLN